MSYFWPDCRYDLPESNDEEKTKVPLQLVVIIFIFNLIINTDHFFQPNCESESTEQLLFCVLFFVLQQDLPLRKDHLLLNLRPLFQKPSSGHCRRYHNLHYEWIISTFYMACNVNQTLELEMYACAFNKVDMYAVTWPQDIRIFLSRQNAYAPFIVEE